MVVASRVTSLPVASTATAERCGSVRLAVDPSRRHFSARDRSTARLDFGRGTSSRSPADRRRRRATVRGHVVLDGALLHAVVHHERRLWKRLGDLTAGENLLNLHDDSRRQVTAVAAVVELSL